MGNPLLNVFDRKAGAIVGAGIQLTRRGTELAVDRILDQRYRILEPIGAGGSSQVYLAQDTALGREVAVKLLDPQAAADGTLRKLFVKEARALAQLTHPNIVAVYDVGEVDGLPFIVMEHVAGSSLKQRIERSGALPLADAVRLTDEIANGLAFAHSRGIIHADLKPSNILLDLNDQPKICDFGIARTPAEDSDSPQLFATALYVAPERVEGRPASVASDVYGLGLVVYEMLVGKPPFTSGNAAVLLRDHVVRPPVTPEPPAAVAAEGGRLDRPESAREGSRAPLPQGDRHRRRAHQDATDPDHGPGAPRLRRLRPDCDDRAVARLRAARRTEPRGRAADQVRAADPPRVLRCCSRRCRCSHSRSSPASAWPRRRSWPRSCSWPGSSASWASPSRSAG